MKVCRPDFYKDFQCIGSKCKDTCCALWEIEVDETSAERYALDQGPLAEDFKKYLVRKEDENYFRLTAEKRCPFLNEDNLCRMILTMGEDYICDICREHPRFYHWFGDLTEVGLGLCCEEAGRLLFSRKTPLGFEILSDEEEMEAEEMEAEEMEAEQTEEEVWEEDYWVELLLRARSSLVEMLQNRGLSLKTRVERLLSFGNLVQPFLDEEDVEGMEAFLEDWAHGDNVISESPLQPKLSSLEEMLSFFEKMESLDYTWPEQMRTMKKKLPELLELIPSFAAAVKEADREVDYEHLLVYFVFRYFMEAIYDSNILSPIRFAVVSLQMLFLLDLENWSRTGTYTLEDRIRIAKWYSKEIEYCPDNMELITEHLEEEGIWQ